MRPPLVSQAGTIIELVDSICSDSVGVMQRRHSIFDDTKKSLKISKKRKLISLYNSVPLIFMCFHDQQHA